MESMMTVTFERSASGATLRNESVSHRFPDWPADGDCKLTIVEPKSETVVPAYCRLAPQMDQSESSSRVKQTFALTCFPSRQARSTVTSIPLESWLLTAGCACTVGYDGSINAVGPEGVDCGGGTKGLHATSSNASNRIVRFIKNYQPRNYAICIKSN